MAAVSHDGNRVSGPRRLHDVRRAGESRYHADVRTSLAPFLIVAIVSIFAACTPPAGDGDDDDDDTNDTGDGDGDGDGWNAVVHTNDEQGAIMSVWGPTQDEVYVVGGQIGPSTGFVLRFDGEEWIDEALPADTAMLDWVYGVDGKVWAVGQAGAIVRREGGAWVAEDSTVDNILWGIWGASEDELWAVGGDGFSDNPVLLRRSADTWEQVALPDLGTEAYGLFKIWGTADDDVWAVGDGGSTVHWDGNLWTAYPTDEGVDLISVWGSDDEGVVAVGGRASGRLARWTGSDWASETLSVPGLNGVWVDPAGGVTAVGNQGTILDVEPDAFGFEMEDSGTLLVLHAVYGFSGGPRFAVGGSLLSPPPYVGIVLRID